MGQSKTGGYQKLDAISPEQNTALQQLLQQFGPNSQQAAQGFQQFLPGGGGGQAISDAAHNRFQQQTVPSILGAFGQNSKGSSALNQALAGGAANLNTDIAAQLSQMQLQAAQGLGSLGSNQAQLGLGTNQFAYAPRQQPFWQQALLGAIGAGGNVAGSIFGRPGA